MPDSPFVSRCVNDLLEAARLREMPVLALSQEEYDHAWHEDLVSVTAGSIARTFGGWQEALAAAEMSIKVPAAFKSTYLQAEPAGLSAGAANTILVKGVEIAVPDGALAYQLVPPRWISDAAEAKRLMQRDPGQLIFTQAGQAALKEVPEKISFVVTVQSVHVFAARHSNNPRLVLRELVEEAERARGLCLLLLTSGWTLESSDGDSDEINWVFSRTVSNLDELVDAYRPVLEAAGDLADRYEEVEFSGRWLRFDELLSSR